jgi:hypothetical protein
MSSNATSRFGPMQNPKVKEQAIKICCMISVTFIGYKKNINESQN